MLAVIRHKPAFDGLPEKLKATAVSGKSSFGRIFESLGGESFWSWGFPFLGIRFEKTRTGLVRRSPRFSSWYLDFSEGDSLIRRDPRRICPGRPVKGCKDLSRRSPLPSDLSTACRDFRLTFSASEMSLSQRGLMTRSSPKRETFPEALIHSRPTRCCLAPWTALWERPNVFASQEQESRPE